MARYFSEDEVAGLDPKLVEMLDAARGFAGVPFIITEGLARGGSHVENTAHSRGLAADIRCSASHTRMLMLAAAMLAKFRRIGLYDKHVHLDCDPSLPQDVIWIGKSA